MEIIVDKIGSVTKNIKLKNIVPIEKRIITEEGAVIVVEVQEDKKIYNQLEQPSGRMSTLHKGDIVVVALGNRRALRGFVGEIPTKLRGGDIIHVLNLGGVAGICTSENYQEVGHALKIKIIGTVIDKDGSPLNIKKYKLFEPSTKIKSKIPLIIVSGTCMEVGKTTTACEIIKFASRDRKTVSAAKVAGIAALKDALNMQDYGAIEVVTMIDAGYTSTANSTTDAVTTTKGAINFLSKANPDYIVVELGDGVFGEYGVIEILKDTELQQNIIAHIGCAYDPAGAMKLMEVCNKVGSPLDLISGPVTDNSVGTNFIIKNLGIGAINSLTNGEKVFAYLQKYCLARKGNSRE